ncbi:MAG TPA: hypothetical protein VJT49_08475 [Amycolatopsis sp.]|uniref:hypothetical protein n=1 Tax=Amycolatopsis sp. TaxID=37632 RepID=UPI002B48EE24|nr:hypothetical protein [Amycolatopsis sp.]HKS45135.1 hypothetical protein [Amycolatopsis sp.]
MTEPRTNGGESVERVAVQVDRLCWSGVLLGLAFTMTNVQQFAANGARSWSLPWCTAWLLDPMVSVVLLSILRAEQVTARYGVRTGGWVRVAKWFTLTATYVMNTWEAFTTGSPSRVVLHSVPPLVVFVAAEAVTDLRDKLGAAMVAARSAAFMNAAEPTPASAPETPTAVPPGTTSAGDTSDNATPGGTVSAGNGSAERRRRTSFAEYLAMARQARTPEVSVTPAWVRQVTGCSRGLSSRLAATLIDEGGGR